MKLLRLTGKDNYIYYVNMERVQVIVRGLPGSKYEGTTTLSFKDDETWTVMETPEEIQLAYNRAYLTEQ
jgi:hypothetical protein